jgi:small GTP-binding protein
MAQNLTPYKIILLGETSVGKSSILTRYTKDIFTELTVSTIQEFYTEKEIEIRGSPMKFQIWDTAGQEKFRSIVKNYYLGSIAAILVYDITNRESFNKVVNYWYKEIKEHIPNISMYNYKYNIIFYSIGCCC